MAKPKQERYFRPMVMKLTQETFPEYDLGDLADREGISDEERASAEKWRGWKVLYRKGVTTRAYYDFKSGDITRYFDAFPVLVAGWNFHGYEGEELPQPTQDNFYTFALPDDLYMAIAMGFAEVARGPKAI